MRTNIALLKSVLIWPDTFQRWRIKFLWEDMHFERHLKFKVVPPMRGEWGEKCTCEDGQVRVWRDRKEMTDEGRQATFDLWGWTGERRKVKVEKWGWTGDNGMVEGVDSTTRNTTEGAGTGKPISTQKHNRVLSAQVYQSGLLAPKSINLRPPAPVFTNCFRRASRGDQTGGHTTHTVTSNPRTVNRSSKWTWKISTCLKSVKLGPKRGHGPERDTKSHLPAATMCQVCVCVRV